MGPRTPAEDQRRREAGEREVGGSEALAAQVGRPSAKRSAIVSKARHTRRRFLDGSRPGASSRRAQRATGHSAVITRASHAGTPWLLNCSISCLRGSICA